MTDNKKIDGKLYKFVDGQQVLLCADCEKDMPIYRDAPSGYVSPESSEVRLTSIMGLPGVEALEKPVCVECYLKAFQRVYPGEKLPKLSKE